MSKQWGHGFYYGKNKALDIFYEDFRTLAEQYAYQQDQWKAEILNKLFSNNSYQLVNIKKGIHLLFKCIFHEEQTSSSCCYWPIDNKFYCFSCGEEGDGFKLAHKFSNS